MTIDTTRGCLVVEAGQHAATLTTRPHTGVPITQVIIQRHTPYQDILDIAIDAPAAAKLGAWLTQWADQHKQGEEVCREPDHHSR